jgi:thiol:disulfide interchange protein
MLRQVGLAATISVALLLAGCAAKDGSSAAPGASSSRSAGAVASKAASAPSTAAAETIPDHYDPARNPAVDLQAALALAATDRKEVLIDFGADWCPDCRVLDRLFQSEQTKPLLQRYYHVVAVDVGQFNHNLGFAAKYVNLETSGIPALVVLTPDGTIRVATNDGSFENARTMNSDQVNAFLTHWAPAG